MTDREYDFDLEGFRTARIDSAHHLGDYVVEWWDDDWEDRYWAEMEEIKAKEISKFQERLAREVFHQPVLGGSLMVAESSKVPQAADESHGSTFTNEETTDHSEALKDVGNILGEEGASTIRHVSNNSTRHTDTIMTDDGSVEDITETSSFNIDAKMNSEEDIERSTASSLGNAVTDPSAPPTPAISPDEMERNEDDEAVIPTSSIAASPFSKASMNETGFSIPSIAPNDTEREEEKVQPKKPSIPPSPSLRSTRKPKSRSQINTSRTPNSIQKPKKPRSKTTFTWLHPHRMTIAIILKHFDLSWPNLEKIFSHIYPEDVKKGGKVPGSSDWVGNIRFQWVRESRTFKSARHYDPVQAEIESDEGEESVEYKQSLREIVKAMGTLGIGGRLADGERKVLNFSKK